jgi:hypothetical protein
VKAYDGIQRLAEMAGFPPAQPQRRPSCSEGDDTHESSHERGRLRVLIAQRSLGRRGTRNLDELIRACDCHRRKSWCDERGAGSGGGPLSPVDREGPSLACRAVDFTRLDWTETVRVMREAHAYVTVHGGTTSNALYMRPGSVVLQVVAHGFERTEDDTWLNHEVVQLQPTMRFVRLLVNSTAGPNPSVLDAWNADIFFPVQTVLRRLREEWCRQDGR